MTTATPPDATVSADCTPTATTPSEALGGIDVGQSEPVKMAEEPLA